MKFKNATIVDLQTFDNEFNQKFQDVCQILWDSIDDGTMKRLEICTKEGNDYCLVRKYSTFGKYAPRIIFDDIDIEKKSPGNHYLHNGPPAWFIKSPLDDFQKQILIETINSIEIEKDA